MFEALGVCRESAKKMREDLTKARAEIRSNIEDETYLDTKQVTPRKVKERRASWRVRIREMTLDEYKKELDTEILEVQEYRRRQLLRIYPCATFETLDGRRWSAIPLKNDAWTHAPSKVINSPYQLLNDAPIVQAKILSNWQLFDSFCNL
jgi:hypothetical protein